MQIATFCGAPVLCTMVGLQYEWTGKVTDYLTTLNESEVSNTRLAMMRLEYRLFEHYNIEQIMLSPYLLNLLVSL